MALPSHNFMEYQRYSDPNCSKEGIILPITNSVRSGRGISISFGEKSKGGRSNSRQHRKPIFSKENSQNYLEGSKYPRELERRNSNRVETLNQNTIPRPFSSKDLPLMQNLSSNSNIFNVMREQFQLAISNLHFKMNDEIKKNNEQLMRLESKLRNTESILVEKENELGILRQKLDRAIFDGRFHSISEMGLPESDQFSRNFQYLTTKLRDVDIKIRTMSSQYKIAQSQKASINLHRLQQKVDVLSNIIFKDIKDRLQQISNRIANLSSNYQSNLKELEQDVVFLKSNKLELNQVEQKAVQMEERILMYKKDFQNTVRLVQSYSSKEFKYDNYELKTLRAKIEAVIQSVISFEGEKAKVNTYLGQIGAEHNILISKIKQCISLKKEQDGRVLEPGKIKSKRQLESSSNVKVFTNSTKLVSTKTSQNSFLNDTFVPHQDETTYEVFEDENGEKAQHMLQRLIETIRKTRNTTPLQCEIDETGYLKYTKSGTYVFDLDGNLFQLSPSEINLATTSKIIVLP